jgi:hypothetical protein
MSEPNLANVDTTVKLWDYFYRIRIPVIASTSLEDLRKFGTRITGIKAIDSTAHSQTFVRYASIADMLKFYKEGVPVRLVDPGDAKVIYEDISLHIHSWKTRLERGINIGEAPIDDLITMDQFASTVYEHAKLQFSGEYLDSIIGKQLQDHSPIGPTTFFDPAKLAKKGENVTIQGGDVFINKSQEDARPRDSLEDFFRDRLLTLRPPR